MFNRISLAIAVAALVAGCSSGVDLDNAPVEDRAGSALPTTGSNGAGSGSTGQSSVAGVDLSQSARDAAGPVGVGKVVHFFFVGSDFSGLIFQLSHLLIQLHTFCSRSIVDAFFQM